MSLINSQNQKLKHINQMDNNCHISYFVQALYNAANVGLNLYMFKNIRSFNMMICLQQGMSLLVTRCKNTIGTLEYSF